MRFEIQKHLQKLKKISKLSEVQLQISLTQVLSKIIFKNVAIIPLEMWLYAEYTTKNIDEEDVDFVALAKFLKASLWTGVKELYYVLAKKKFRKLLNTKELLELRNIKREK